MSFTQLNYPAAFATEGDPLAGGFPGDMDPYVHGVNDTMDVDDEKGYFSIDVRFNLPYSQTLLIWLAAYGTIHRTSTCFCC